MKENIVPVLSKKWEDRSTDRILISLKCLCGAEMTYARESVNKEKGVEAECPFCGTEINMKLKEPLS